MSQVPKHLVHWLRKVKLEWELDLEKLAQIAHVDPVVLNQVLSLSSSEIEALPTIPTGLENSMALVAIYQRLTVSYPDVRAQNDWLITESPLLENHKPIEVMGMSAEHLSWVSYVLNGDPTRD